MKFFLSVVSAAVLVALGTASAKAASITTDTSVTDSIPGVSTFTTRGSNMAGMLVTVITSTGSETIAWSTIDALLGSGHAAGSNWEISLTGNSFVDNAWVVTFASGVLIQSILLEGEPGMVLFDRAAPDPGTPDSAGGKDFHTSLSSTIDSLVAAQYSRQIAIGAALPVGDEWRTLSIDFTAASVQAEFGRLTGFTFTQDTDNVVRSPIPEPGSLGLLSGGLLGFAALRRRRHRP